MSAVGLLAEFRRVPVGDVLANADLEGGEVGGGVVENAAAWDSEHAVLISFAGVEQDEVSMTRS